MAEDARIWEISDNDSLKEIKKSHLHLEERIEKWLEQDISILSDDLLVIGRQVDTAICGIIDLLCLDIDGDVVIVELKRDKTPREVTAQVLDYASWVKELSNDKITEIATKYLADKAPLDEAFKQKFEEELPETLNSEHKMLIVGSEIDARSERIINYLSDTYGVGINAATFQYFKNEKNQEFLARVFLIEPSEVEYKTKTKTSSKRKPYLTYEQLEQISENNGVKDLYLDLFEGLSVFFDQNAPTTHSICFMGKFGDKRKVIFSLIPKDSKKDEGIKFQVYIHRLAEYMDVDIKYLTEILPQNHQDWAYQKSDSLEWSGFEGFFSNKDEINRFIKDLNQLRKK